MGPNLELITENSFVANALQVLGYAAVAREGAGARSSRKGSAECMQNQGR